MASARLSRSRRPSAHDYLRRRVVAGAAALALVLVLVSLIHGDASTPLAAHSGKLTATDRAMLPWRRPVASGPAGPLTPAGLPTAKVQQAAVARYLALGQPIFCSGGRGRYVALTFDDGPSVNVPRALSMLASARERATFFLIGRQISEFKDVPKQEQRLGAVADHTWNHPNLTRLSPSEQNFELGATKRALIQSLGAPVTLFRPPYGARNAATDRLVRRFGLLQILWNVDTRDSGGASTPGIIQNAKDGLQPGSIILMHEHYPNTMAALGPILTEMRRRHLQSVSLPELLALDPPSDALVRAGYEGCQHRADYLARERASDMRLRGRA